MLAEYYPILLFIAVGLRPPCPGYVKDHVVPLACRGPDTVANLQWQTVPDARAKDKWERKRCFR